MSEYKEYHDLSLLSAKEVLELYPMCMTTLWDRVKTGRFPKPVPLGGQKRYWRFGDIRKLIENGITGGGEAV